MESAVTPAAPGPGTNGVGTTTSFAAIDPARVVDHLAVLLEATLGATRAELEAPGSLLSKPRYSDTLQRCNRFAVDTQVALYIQKDLSAAEGLENGDVEDGMAFPALPALWGLWRFIWLGVTLMMWLQLPRRMSIRYLRTSRRPRQPWLS